MLAAPFHIHSSALSRAPTHTQHKDTLVHRLYTASYRQINNLSKHQCCWSSAGLPFTNPNAIWVTAIRKLQRFQLLRNTFFSVNVKLYELSVWSLQLTFSLDFYKPVLRFSHLFSILYFSHLTNVNAPEKNVHCVKRILILKEKLHIYSVITTRGQ